MKKRTFHVSFAVSSDGYESFPSDPFQIRELLFCNLEHSSMTIIGGREAIAVQEQPLPKPKKQAPLVKAASYHETVNTHEYL